MIGYGLFRPKYARVNHIYESNVWATGEFIPLRSLCKKRDGSHWDAGKSYRPWFKLYADADHPAAVKDSPMRTTCKECRRIAKTFPVRRTETA